MSRSLAEILEAVRLGQTPEVDELFYAVASLDLLMEYAVQDIRGVVETGRPWLSPLLDSVVSRLSVAYPKAPRDFLGPGFDPRCPEYQAWYREALETRRRMLH